ncbi:hypothetical protein [Parasphingorhabdus pacifica]
MDRKIMIGIGTVAAAGIVFLLVKDPVGSADATRAGWEMLVGAVATIANSLVTFFQHLVQ